MRPSDRKQEPDLAQTLARVPLFSGLSAEELAPIVAASKWRVYDKGEALFQEGDPAVGFYVVASGRVKIFKVNPEGREQILHLVGPGQSFAEAAVFGPGYPASAQTLEAARVVFVEAGGFKAALAGSSQLAFKMIASLSMWLRRLERLIEDLSLKDAASRFAGLALALAELAPGGKADSVPVQFSKSTLALRLGVANETLSRTLRRFEEEGVLTFRGKTLRVLDRERLERIARGEERLA